MATEKLHMNHPIWVLTYLYVDEAGAWPEVHTFCFETEEEAHAYHRSKANSSDYHVHKTWLQTKSTEN